MRNTISKITQLVFKCSAEKAEQMLNNLDKVNLECVLKYSPAFTFANENWDEFSAELEQQLKDVPAPKDGSMTLVETRAVYAHRFLRPSAYNA